MNDSFEIRPGNYRVPNIGFIDTTKKLSNQTLVALALSTVFPFIQVNEKSFEVLKKAKLKDDQITSLIQQADSVQRIDWLLQLTETKAVHNIATTRKKALK